jgi:hypothetical protein
MVARFWVGGTGTWDASATTNWAASTGGASGASAPTAADDVTVDANSGNGTITIAAGAACNNLTVTWTAVKTNILSLSANFAPAGALNLSGGSQINAFCVQSNSIGTARTITVGTAPTLLNVCFQDITAAGAGGTWAGTTIGDCGGNTNITPTPAATQTATGTASFAWSTHGWTSRVPLPQDDVVINNAFVGGRTITMDMPRSGRSLDFSACTGSPQITMSAATEVTGSFVLGGGVGTFNTASLTLKGRGSFLVTSAGKSFGNVTVACPGGTYTAQDAFSSTGTVSYTQGTFSANGFSFTCQAMRADNSTDAKTVNMGAGTWTMTGSNIIGSTVRFNSASLTLNASTSTLKFTDATATAKALDGGGKTYSTVWFNNAGAGTFDIIGSNTYLLFQVDPGRFVRFTAGTTQTAANYQFGLGCTIGSITAAGHTLAKSGGGHVQVEQAIISRSTASPANTFYATGSTDNGNNVNWTFGSFTTTLVADVGVFAMTGFAAGLYRSYVLAADFGAFTINGQAATLVDLDRDENFIVEAKVRNFIVERSPLQ